MYDVRKLELSDAAIRDAHQLLREVFPAATHITPDYLAWQYVRNPVGEAVGFNAFAGETLAAHYVTLPVRAMVDGRPERGVLSLNTATHPAHQGKKLFTTLAEATYAHAASQGYSFVIGVANANSTPGFTRKLGFQLVAPLEARLGVGPLPSVDAGFTPGFEVAWDKETLAWRLSNPSRAYRVRHRDGRAQVEAPTGRYGIQALLGDFPAAFCEPREGQGPPVLNPVRLWLGLEPGRRFSRSLYRTLPGRLRPSPLNLIYRDLTGQRSGLDVARVRFRALDFDAY